MSQTTEWTQIDIDLDVHKAIEAERVSFSENANDVLRRKFGLESKSDIKRQAFSSTQQVVNKGWRGYSSEFKVDVFIPEGIELRIEYNGQQVLGKVRGTKMIFNENAYDTPSRAAIEETRTQTGQKTNLNGWRLVEAKRPTDGRWVLLRQIARLASKGQSLF